ncbi:MULTISPECIES: conjugal transfer protein TraF [Cysteiniphilum]|uniref:conjugal transfer protein TraF n=1 Tax=Cysteiniphilum TaxID=2056696 RepID=UPI0017867F78|nr:MULTISPECIES: conjugal transfer protein TraF [Cysteiniphilum]
MKSSKTFSTFFTSFTFFTFFALFALLTTANKATASLSERMIAEQVLISVKAIETETDKKNTDHDYVDNEAYFGALTQPIAVNNQGAKGKNDNKDNEDKIGKKDKKDKKSKKGIKHKEYNNANSEQDNHAIVFFMSGSCGYCHKLSPLVKQLADEFNLEVYPFSFDAQGTPEYPNVMPVVANQSRQYCDQFDSSFKNSCQLAQRIYRTYYGDASPFTPVLFLQNTENMRFELLARGYESVDVLTNKLRQRLSD